MISYEIERLVSSGKFWEHLCSFENKDAAIRQKNLLQSYSPNCKHQVVKVTREVLDD